MGKLVPDAVLDDMLKTIVDNANKLVICSTQPTTYTEANATYALGSISLTVGDGNGDYTIANGDSSGRKLTVAQQTGISISATGTAAHIALVNTSDSSLKAVTTCTSQSVTSGNTATVNTFDLEISDVS